jgi:hypothetical protein
VIRLTELTYDYLRPFEEQRIMHFYSKIKDSENYMMVFQGDNETTPYDFLVGSPLFISGLVADYKIEELDLRVNVGQGELARVFTYLATM